MCSPPRLNDVSYYPLRSRTTDIKSGKMLNGVKLLYSYINQCPDNGNEIKKLNSVSQIFLMDIMTDVSHGLLQWDYDSVSRFI